MRSLYYLALFIILPAQASAFPIAEGAGALSSLIGVISAMLVGSLPKGAARGAQTKVFAITAIAVLSVCAAIGAGIWGMTQSNLSQSYEMIARQSRPNLELTGEINARLHASAYQDPTGDDLAFLKERKTLIDINAYRRGEDGKGAVLAYIDYDETAQVFQPSFITLNYGPEQTQEIIELVSSSKSEVIIVSPWVKQISDTALRVELETGVRLRAIWTGGEDFALIPPSEDLPRVHNPQEVFTMPLVDIRTEQSVRETHTLINAQVLPLLDLLLMTDEQIKTIVGLTGEMVFVEYDEMLYGALHARLKDTVGGSYQFYTGGLEKHYFQDNLTTTPFYYNMRSVDPRILMDIASLTDRLRFICTVASQCLDNIPEQMRVDLPYRDMNPNTFKQAVENLPKGMLYTTVSSNQETHGNSLITGYWLNQSGHDYVGDLAMHERFSYEEIRERVNTALGGNPTLEDYRQSRSFYLGFLSFLRGSVDAFGWPVTFAAFGVMMRLALMPAQTQVYRSYYTAKPSALASLLGAGVILTALLVAYRMLDTAISYYAVIPHGEMTGLLYRGTQDLLVIFIAMVTLQAFISFPKRPQIAIAIALGVVALWASGMMHTIPAPLLVFLMASEAVALTAQILPFGRFVKLSRAAKDGIHYEMLPHIDRDKYPAKWALVQNYQIRGFRNRRASADMGFLVELLPDLEMKRVAKAASSLTKGRVIVRSASSNSDEQMLAGVHHSPVCENNPESIYNALAALTQSGCDFAWIQPYFEDAITGVGVSVTRGGGRMEIVSGSAGAATEGSRDTQVLSPGQRAVFAHDRAARRLLRRVERAFGGPVIIEFAYHCNKIILLQVRPQDTRTWNEAKLWPGSAADIMLAEDFLAKCTALTGTIMEHVSGGRYVYIRGFLYRKTKMPMSWPRRHRSVHDIETTIADLLTERRWARTLGPAAQDQLLRDVLTVYEDIYTQTQTKRFAHKTSWTKLASPLVVLDQHHELEVIGGRYLVTEPIGEQRSIDRREHLHLLSVAATFLLNKVLTATYGEKDMRGELTLDDVLSATPLQPAAHEVDTAPLPIAGMDRTTDNGVIVSGEIFGKPWPAQHGGLPPARGYVLIGEEIGSEWAAHLDKFSGILACYGHANSHLGITARALGIPFRIVSQEQLEKFKAAAHFRYNG